MRISINWLKELVDYDLPTPELAQRLNGAGLEVAQIDVYGSPTLAAGVDLPENQLDWNGIVIGRILEVKAHPNADRLRIAIVDYGQGPKQSVTGAPNIDVGSADQKVVVATAGTRIVNAYGNDPATLKVRPAKLRGERSEIVLCSEKELNISDEHEGILLLDDDAPVGAALSEVLGDVVIEVELTPNLARCLNMVGIAREVAALAGGTLKVENSDWVDEGDPIKSEIDVDIEDPGRCARFTAALIRGIHIAPSPFWMRYRLTLAGMRPISNIVDITNYVMLEWGQPLHAYDHHTLKPKAGSDTPYILVRNAKAGEMLKTLDGVERTLTDDMLLITDGRGPIGLAGVMGGADTEVTDQTQDILLEAANFDYVNNRRTAQKLKLFSEASNRFNKGLPPELPELGLKRAADLMRQLAGGTVAKGFLDVYPKKPESKAIDLPVTEPSRLLGVELSPERLIELLNPLGFECALAGDHIRVRVPYYRLDVRLPADLVEEVARMLDYDKLPTTLLSDGLPQQRDNLTLKGKVKLKRTLTQLGLQEVINYTLTNPDTVGKMNPADKPIDPNDFVQLANTLSSERSLMRQSILPNLLETAERNWRFQNRVGVFEVGRVFLPQAGEPLPVEPTYLGIVMLGERQVSCWLNPDEKVNFFDIKGVIEGLLSGMGVKDFESKISVHPSYHSGRCADIYCADKQLGTFGELHPQVADAFGLEGRVCAAQLNLDQLLTLVPGVPDYQAPPRFPSVMQDIALVVDQTLPHTRVQALICELGRPLLSHAQLFDVYTGEHVPEGKRSLAYALTYQAPDRTLTDEDVTQVHEAIQKGLREKLNAEIRGLD